MNRLNLRHDSTLMNISNGTNLLLRGRNNRRDILDIDRSRNRLRLTATNLLQGRLNLHIINASRHVTNVLIRLLNLLGIALTDDVRHYGRVNLNIAYMYSSLRSGRQSFFFNYRVTFLSRVGR